MPWRWDGSPPCVRWFVCVLEVRGCGRKARLQAKLRSKKLWPRSSTAEPQRLSGCGLPPPSRRVWAPKKNAEDRRADLAGDGEESLCRNVCPGRVGNGGVGLTERAGAGGRVRSASRSMGGFGVAQQRGERERAAKKTWGGPTQAVAPQVCRKLGISPFVAPPELNLARA